MRNLAGMLAVSLTFLLVDTLSAGTRSCTTAMVNLNICRSTSDIAYCLPIGTTDPDGGGPLLAPSITLADAFAVVFNWQNPAACTSDMVAAGVCTSGQLGTLVTVTKAQFADLQVRSFVRDVMRRYLRQVAIANAAAAADAVSDPDIGN